jgi:hypothetical protein
MSVPKSSGSRDSICRNRGSMGWGGGLVLDFVQKFVEGTGDKGLQD